MGDDEATRVLHLVDLPGDPGGADGLDLIGPVGPHGLDQSAWGVDDQVLTVAEHHIGRFDVRHVVVAALGPVLADRRCRMNLLRMFPLVMVAHNRSGVVLM